jgi:diguanylate cyclase (GGDEF)-like protein
MTLLLGESNQLYRYGGEEFVVLTSSDINLSTHIAEKIRSTVSETSFDNKTIEVSIGLTAIKNTDTQISLLERADKALLIAKQKGRNQVSVGNT